ncbi:MAG: hypothetical protein ABIQ95_14165, partial [Bdellovibrionia bacterium]
MFSFSSNFGKIAILFFLFTLPASAEIDHRKLKGIQKLTRPEYQFLSPVYGFGVLKKGILENLYFYGPQEDKTVQLIRLMFHSVDQITFVATHLPTKVATYLDTYAIGVLLRLSLSLTDDSSHQDHESRFLKAIHKAIGLDDEELTRERFKGKERQLLRKGSKEFVATLLGAFDETLGPSRKYPAHFVEHVLLGLFWKKAKNEKSEFIHLLAEIPQALAYEKEDFLFNSGWSEDNYTVDDYNENVSKYKKLNFPTLATSPLLNNPEVAAYLAYSYKVWDNFLPPIFEYENAELTLDDGTVEDFYDCGETSVRNFLNIVLKNSETQSLDTRFLRAPADAWNLTISPALIDFYERNSSLSGFGSAELHHQWANVVSQLPGVSYRQPSGKPVCNITNGFKSVMKVFENLIFSTDHKFASLSAEKQLDQIVQFFSRPDFELSWDLVGMNREEISLNVGFEVRFFINQLPCFTWKFNPGHFIVSPISSTRSDWRKELSIILANEYSEMLTAKADQGSGSFTHLTQVSWFVFEETLGSVISKLKNSLLSNSELQYLFWSIPLKANQAKLYAIQTVISNRWDSLYPTSIKL